MKRILFAMFTLFVLCSCNDWFDLAPKDDYIDENSLFSSESAFRNAMNGIYTELRVNQLYGSNLTLGGVEFMGQTFVPDSELKPVADLDYSSKQMQDISSDVWKTMYSSIYSCNTLTRLLEEKKEVVFVKGSREMMLAELKALRAMLHYELVRLYHPQVIVDDNFKRVVWMESINATPVILTNKELVMKITTELTAAISDLKKYDPISTRVGYNTEALFGTKPTDRVWKMNYFAALGMKARISMGWKTTEGYTEALHCADTVIKSGYFSFVATAGTDLGFSPEHLWGLAPADKDFSKLATNLFAEREIIVSGVVNTVNWKASAPDDIRFKWFKADLKNMLPKFDEKSLVKDSDTPARIPMIKLGEIYLIAAEAALELNDLTGTYNYLKTFVDKRFSKTTLTASSGATELRSEIRTLYTREFLGEGQLFYSYKRWNLSSITGYDGREVNMASKYVWAVPGK